MDKEPKEALGGGSQHPFTSKNENAFIGHSGLVLLQAPPEGSFDVELPF
jgi:hypothetical protein